jgi:hypothetical protein
MTTSRYRVAINGLWCHSETWDDAFNWDGKHDEVFLDVNVKFVDERPDPCSITSTAKAN